ncbi:MAG: MATE family efflux transporter [Bacteroidetes bacterium]|nr:MATE family efflux transporter [Bacteroidota bacterium]
MPLLNLNTEIPSTRRIWDIAWPIMISLLAQNIVGVTDTAFLGRVGEVELGAAALGGLFYIIIFMVCYGFTTGVQILVARRHGEKNYSQIGKIFDNSLYFLAFISLLVTGLIYLCSSFILKPIISSPEVFKAATTFLSYRIFGLFFASMGLLFRSFYTGITDTRYLSISAGIMAGLNIILAYAMIFGKFGLPPMGIAGAAIASCISEFCAAIFLFLVTIGNKRVKVYQLFRWVKPEWEIIKSTLGVSVFVMIQFVLSLSVWFVFFLIIEKMGERPLAISNIARSIYMFLMIPGWALCSVTNTLVSNVLGEGKPEQVLPITFKIMKFSVALLLVVVVIAAFIPVQVLGVFTNDQSLIQAAIPTYYIILSALFLFSLMSVLFNAVLGTANTRITLIIEVVTLSFYVMYCWFIAIILKKPVQIVWTSEWVYAFFLGTFSYFYLKKGKWRDRKV